jgi:hypothetical protein
MADWPKIDKKKKTFFKKPTKTEKTFFNPETETDPDRNPKFKQKTDPDRLPKVNPAGL